ncbi:hypothetical protein ACWDO0_28235 [Nocardia rhamnosiphila]
MLEKVDLPFPPSVVRQIEEKRAAHQRASFDAAFKEMVAASEREEQVRRQEIKAAALKGEGRRAAMEQVRTIGSATHERREAGVKFDHRAHWRRLRDPEPPASA